IPRPREKETTRRSSQSKPHVHPIDVLVIIMKLTSLVHSSLALALTCFIASNAMADDAVSTEGGETSPGQKAESGENESMFVDGEDGWLDISKFVDQAYGFVPMVIPITEPTVGLGAIGLVAFLDKPDKTDEGTAMRPNIMAVGGLATENGTWGVFGADIRNWMDGRVESMIGGAYVNVNL
ncbi:MAG: hypothetical protein DRP71_07165, partial [Verrucomicrobia bacterium]